MEKFGWKFDVTVSMTGSDNTNYDYRKQCDNTGYWSDTWYGGRDRNVGPPVGSVSAVFDGSGTATLFYGNCYDNGLVKVYLNTDLLSTAAAHVSKKKVMFNFVNGDVLILTEEKAIIKLNEIDVQCTGK